ncbi:hypothetical protein HYT52_02280 [Candidatus Woesearchaeota archaeon]|nr:hypothetical protein [Candidatus Woesearchaeota archaeon]
MAKFKAKKMEHDAKGNEALGREGEVTALAMGTARTHWLSFKLPGQLTDWRAIAIIPKKGGTILKFDYRLLEKGAILFVDGRSGGSTLFLIGDVEDKTPPQ